MGMMRRWFRGRPSDEEMREELEAHVAMRAEHDRVDEAAARRRLGNVLQTRERMRRVWIAEWWDALVQDARFTWRSWRRQPGFAVAAVLVLALGLGASMALFAALDRVLFRPLPYADPDRLVSVGLITPGPFGPAEIMPDTGYVQVWDTTPPPPFESVTAVAGTDTCDIAEEQPERVQCGRVEANLLRMLGLSVVAGRDFVPEDDVRGAPLVALISHGLWVRRYGGDPSVVGRTLSLDSTDESMPRVPIAGVLPPEFEMPFGAADILLPAQLRPLDPQNLQQRIIRTFARLEPDVTPERAESMLEPHLPRMQAFMPPASHWSVRPLRDVRIGDASRAGWLLVGAVAVFLLIACVNVTNLTLTRVAERQREFAVRAAVGAGKVRLARLALAESLLLSLMAGSVGLLVAFALLKTFVAIAPAGIPGIADASIDVRVFAVAAMLVVVTGMAIGSWPAISVFRTGGLQGLRGASTSTPAAGPRIRFALMTTQVALTLALLGGSALLLRTLWNVVSIPLGFEAERVITLSAGLSATRYATPEQRSAFFEELLARVRVTPGAASAALSSAPPPLGANLAALNVEVEGLSTAPGTRHPPIRIREVSPGYFETFRISMTGGRSFRETDRDGEPAVVLSESTERILFAGERALGRRIRLGERTWYTVVGVAADLRNGQRVTGEPVPEAYVIARRGQWRSYGYLALRTTATLRDTEAFLRQIAADLDPLLPVTVQAAGDQVTRLTERPRFVASLLTAFAVLALLLAAAGLYSVASYLVAQRRRDIGVRMAIGATPRDVAGHVVGEAGRWIIAGALLGCALGWIGTRALQSQLYGVEALDPWSWTGALVALAVALVLAVSRPAYHAAHVDPIAALRAD